MQHLLFLFLLAIFIFAIVDTRESGFSSSATAAIIGASFGSFLLGLVFATTVYFCTRGKKNPSVHMCYAGEDNRRDVIPPQVGDVPLPQSTPTAPVR